MHPGSLLCWGGGGGIPLKSPEFAGFGGPFSWGVGSSCIWGKGLSYLWAKMLEVHPNSHKFLSTQLCKKFPREMLASPSLDAFKSGTDVFLGDMLQPNIIFWVQY